jgi:antitoxin component YwqK of YwqJK toxin-antitoxin module
MTKKKTKIWIWMQNNRILKAISNQETGTLTIYDEQGKILLKRTGLTKQQIKKIEINLSNSRIKRLDDHKEPFTYL